MTHSKELSASESLAWQLAYESGDAYDALQAARTKRVQYEEIGGVGLEGVTVTIDNEVVEKINNEVQAAEYEFDLLKGMAHAAAAMENSPFALGRTASVPAPARRLGTSPGGEPASRPESATPEVTQKRIDDVVIYLLDRGGSVSAYEGGASPGAIIPRDLGYSRNTWNNLRLKLASQKLVYFKKVTPSAKRFKEIGVDEEALAVLKDKGALSADVLAALERREKQAQDAGTEKTGDNPDFLDARGGQETGDRKTADEVDEVPAEPKSGIDEGLTSIRIRHQPARPRKNNRRDRGDDKMFSFGFAVAGRSMSRSVKVGDIKKLPKPVRMLLGWGQVNTPAYDFYKTEEQKREFVLRMVNKGVHEESKLTDQRGLETLIKEALEAGYLHQNGAGPELTAEGMDLVLNTKHGKAKLGHRYDLVSAPKSQVKKEVNQTNGSDLTRATLIA